MTSAVRRNKRQSTITTQTVEKISLEELKTWLWGSANIMRGTVDSSDFKNYIFGLLFLCWKELHAEVEYSGMGI